MARKDVPVKTGLSFEDYLAFEQSSSVKHELENYTQIQNLQAYLLIRQDEAKVEIYQRESTGWHYEVLPADDVLKLPCVNLELSVQSLYTNL